MVTRLDPRHALADSFHHPRALMAGHKRQGHRDAAFQVAEVAVAVPRVEPFDQRLAGMRLVELQFLDAIRLLDLSKDRRCDLHVLSPFDDGPLLPCRAHS